MWEYNQTPPSDFLCHHGIKGMKWGVRRYQNPNGTSTERGKKRRREKSHDHVESRAIKKKRVSEMSNTELNKLNTRMTLENNYKQNRRKSNLGNHIIDEVIIGAVVAGVTASLAKNVSKPLSKGVSNVIDKGFELVKKYGKKAVKYIWS